MTDNNGEYSKKEIMEEDKGEPLLSAEDKKRESQFEKMLNPGSANDKELYDNINKETGYPTFRGV